MASSIDLLVSWELVMIMGMRSNFFNASLRSSIGLCSLYRGEKKGRFKKTLDLMLSLVIKH